MRIPFLIFLFVAGMAVAEQGQPLPTSKHIAAVGKPMRLTGMPMNMALSPDGRYLAILNDGYGSAATNGKQSISMLEVATGQVRDYSDDRLKVRAKQTYFLGLAFSSDGTKLFASMSSLTDPNAAAAGSTGNGIAIYSCGDGVITPTGFLKISLRKLGPGKIAARANLKLAAGEQVPFPAGIAVVKGDLGDRLLVTNNLSDDAILIDASTGEEIHRFDLSTRKVVPGSYPYGAVVTRDGARAYVSLWNASRVAELNLRSGRVMRMIDLRRPKLAGSAGSHPSGMALGKDDRELFVALANTDEVAVIETNTAAVKYVSVRLPGQLYGGVQPNALAVDGPGARLYVALGMANAVAVVSFVGPPRVRGFFATEWYPSALAVSAKNLWVASAKGEGTGPNQPIDRADPCARSKRPYTYIACQLRGSVTQLDLGIIKAELRPRTRHVLELNRMLVNRQSIPFAGVKNPIRHVIYVIKENRSYDQVFGDIKEANGDPSLVLFGQDVTPNQHRLAREFGILDNFYDSGEVSGGGHNWSTSAIGSDYMEKTMQVGYRGRERTYDYEGLNANRIVLEDDVPDVNESGTGYIWTSVARAKLSYRHYGEFVSTQWCTSKISDWGDITNRPEPKCPKSTVAKGETLPAPWSKASEFPWPVPVAVQNIATKPELRGHFDPYYPDFHMWMPDQLRADEFLREFSGFVQARRSGRGTQLPNYVLLRLPNDHTSGEKAGAPTPAAAVADNDLALGRVVDAVSHSPYWDDTAILVLEDDAQDGADHVDAHRSIALVISKYSSSSAAKPIVDSTHYTTVSMVRTLEVLLGLPPMNNNDAHAPVIGSLFTGRSHAPFTADYRNRKNGLLFQVNRPDAPGAAASEAMDFTHADSADTALLNAILWKNRKPDAVAPPMR